MSDTNQARNGAPERNSKPPRLDVVGMCKHFGPLVALDGELLEVGRSCVDAAYRNRSTIQLLLRGIAAYVRRY
ncbi:MAG: GNAT family N-acetyltransferase, partial [Proteobacteria bacterium]|nr:GNAT family N-acetyltransferase [Pseudomonadota bacterium]